MSYRTVDPRMWDDPKFKALTRATREVWFYLLTGPHVTMLPGIQRTSAAIIADGLDVTAGQVRTAFAELEAAGLACVDVENKVVRLPNAPRYNPPANGKVIKGWHNLWESLPESPLKYDHLESLRAALPEGADWASSAWAKDFGKVRIPNRFRIDSESIPLPKSETKSGTHDLDLTLTGHDPEPDLKNLEPAPPGTVSTSSGTPAPVAPGSPATPDDPAAKPARKAAASGIGGEATAWHARFVELTAPPGETAAQAAARAPDDGPFRKRYALVRKTRDAPTLLQSLERGLAGAWWGTRTVMALLSEAAISAGLAPPAVATTRPPPRTSGQGIDEGWGPMGAGATPAETAR